VLRCIPPAFPAAGAVTRDFLRIQTAHSRHNDEHNDSRPLALPQLYLYRVFKVLC